MLKQYRAHPITILANLRNVLFLVLIPAVRGLLTAALGGGLSGWFAGAWLDALSLAAMLGVAALQWRTTVVSTDGIVLRLRKGLLFRRESAARWEHVTTAAIIEKFYLRPFRAVRFRADTLGGRRHRCDFIVLMRSRDAGELLAGNRRQEPLMHVYRPGWRSVLALALLTSNSPGGIAFLATLVSQSGKLLGNEFSRRIIGTFESVARALAFGAPPAAAAIAWALVLGWLVGVLLVFLRYKDYELARCENTISILSGKLTEREYVIRVCDVNFLDVRQSVATKLLRMYSLYLSATGYGKQKDDISCVIPTERAARFAELRERLFPGMSPSPAALRPDKSGLMRFLGEPLLCLAAGSAGLAAALFFFPGWRAFCWFVGLMLLAAALFFLLVRWFDYRSGGVGADENSYTIRYSKALYLHTVIVPRDKAVLLELRQSFFQKRRGSCDLYLYTNAEERVLHRVRSLNKQSLATLLGLS